MKRLFVWLVVIALMLTGTALCEMDGFLGQAMPDFTVETADGRTLALSELLNEKQLVVLNIFASWCPPCEQEFPAFENVYQKYADRMEIVALSGDEDDSMAIIQAYQSDHGLSFPMGSATGTGLMEFLNIMAYPTTVCIDRNGSIGFCQVGSFISEASFEQVISAFLSDDYAGNPLNLYGIYVMDEAGEAVPGAVVNCCTDTTCQVLQTDDTGLAFVVSEPTDYHLELIKVPDGYSFEAGADAYTGMESGYAGFTVAREP